MFFFKKSGKPRPLSGSNAKDTRGDADKDEYSTSLSSSTPDNTTMGLVFGQPLENSFHLLAVGISSIPAVVLRCVEYLDSYGLEEVGLYRVPGSSFETQRLRQLFETAGDVDLFAERPSVYSVADLLKAYIRDLPTPLLAHTITDSFKQRVRFLENYRDQDFSQTFFEFCAAAELAFLATKLGDIQYYTLCWLIGHLARLEYRNETNKMTLSNLGLIFCPTMKVDPFMLKIAITHAEMVFPYPKRITSPLPNQ